jgi:hypothetical protein
MPNLYGIGNGGNLLNGVAVKFHHGTAVSSATALADFS